MIIRKSSAILLLSVAAPSATYAYFSQVNNAHVDFITTEELDDTALSNSAVETTSNRSSLQHTTTSSLWNILEDALQKEKHANLGWAAPTIMNHFEEWVHQYSKEFQTEEEKSKRMLIWLENHVLIETHNAKVSSFTLGHNEFSDMTHVEFKKQMKLGEFTPELIHRDDKVFNFMEYNEVNEEDVMSNLRGSTESTAVVAEERRKLQVPIEPPSANKDTPTTQTTTTDEKDWHHLGFLGPIRQQGTCGACWSFSSIGAIESAMAINKFNQMTPEQQSELIQSNTNNNLGLITPLSEQNLIDCDTLHEKGCAGGLMTTTFDEEEVRNGICSEVDYPYMQAAGTCSSQLCTPVPGSKVVNHVEIIPRKNNALKEALKKQPVTSAMVASDPLFQFYKQGIYQVEDCGRVTKQMGGLGCNLLYAGQDTCLPDINHGVLVVGYGKDETAATDLKTFFKVKNSWGSSWGEGGYFRLARYEEDKTDPMDNWGECAILTLMSFPIME